MVLASNTSAPNPSNSYTGGTIFYGVVPATTTDAALGNASGGLTFDGAAFAPSANFSTSRSVTLTGAGLVLLPATSTTTTLNGSISGSGDLRLNGAGNVVLTGTNSLAGDISLFAGTLSVSSMANLGFGKIDIGGGTLVLSSGFSGDISSRFSDRSNTTYTITNSSGNEITFASSFGNYASFTKAGASDLVLAAENGLTGTVAVTGGALIITHAGALGYGDSETAIASTNNSTSSLVFRGTFTLPAIVTTVGRRFNILGTGYSAGGYNGAIWADGGVVTAPVRLYLGASVTVGCASTGGFIFTGPVDLGASQMLTTRVDGSGNVKLTGLISGTGTSGITKTGNYITEIAPAASSNTYTGTTTVSAGTLLLTSESPDTIRPIPASGAVVLAAGSVLRTSTGTTQKGRARIGSLTNTAGGTIHIGRGT